MKDDLNSLLLQKEIYQILDGDTILDSTGGTETRMPYLSGPILSGMAADFGVPSSYSYGGAQSRWCYVDDMMTNAVETNRVSQLLSMFFNSPQFADLLESVSPECFQAEHDRIVRLAIDAINKRLFFGGNELRSVGSEFVVVPKNSAVRVMAPKLKIVNRQYVKMLSERAMKDVDEGRLDSALTEARTLLEETFCYVIELRNENPSEKGDINRLYSQVGDLYGMHANRDMDVRVRTLISGLNKVISAITEMRNNNSDAHGVGERRVAIRDYHARLAVNAAATVADFILSVAEHYEIRTAN